VTANNRATHPLIRDVAPASRSSLDPGLQTSQDGTVDIYLGPVSPDGYESNWIPTKSGEQFELSLPVLRSPATGDDQRMDPSPTYGEPSNNRHRHALTGSAEPPAKRYPGQ
jgi:hypothetical protein